MISPFRRIVASALLFAFSFEALAASSRDNGPRSGRWAHEESDLRPDPRVIWGRLENGFRYALLPHRGVPGRVAMKLIVLSGSIDERPEELGIAHFTEHMAFHGNKLVDEDAMLSLFRRIGAEYGSDVNAVTSFDFTAYSLDYRENTPGLLAEGVRWFRGTAEGILFEPAAIDRERRVIFAEKRNRDSLADRQLQASFPVVFKGLRFADQSPIGTDRTLRNVTRENFQNFFRRCYRPDLMVFVAAGDFDPAEMEALAKENFAPIARPSEPVPSREEGRADLRSMRAGVFRIPGVGSAETLVASVAPQPARPYSREIAVEAQRRGFVMELFGSRLRYLLLNTGGGEATFDPLLRHDVATANVRVGGRQWADGILGLDLAVRETLRRGFESSEIEPLRRRYLRLATHMADQSPVLDPQILCDGLMESITGHTVFVDPAVEYVWMRDWLQRLTLDEVNQTFRGLWNVDSMAYFVSGDVSIDLKADEILKTVQRHRRGELPYLLPAQPKEVAFALKRPGQQTDVTERRTVPELGAELMRLGNNVRVNFIPNRNEPGIVRASVRVGAGLLTMPGNQPALKEFGLNTFIGSGTVYYQPDQIAQIVEQQFLDFGFDVSDHDAFTFRGTVAPDMLETFLGLTTEFLRKPQFKAYAHKDQRTRAFMTRSAGAVGFGEGMRELMDHLFRGDARFMSGTPLDYISLGVSEVKNWMEDPLANGYVEVTIVGDIPQELVESVARRTLGTLGTRAAEKTADRTLKPVEIRAPAGYKRIEFVGELNVGMVLGNWPVESKLDARGHAALQILSKILELRIRTEVRDRLGYSYAPSAGFDAYGGFEGFSLMRATVDCTPGDAEKIARIVEQTADRLASDGAGEEEFIGGQGIVAGKLRRAFLENEFLVDLFKRAQERPGRIDDIIALHGGLVGEVTIEEVNEWAKKILPAGNCRSASLVPKPFVGIFDSARP